MKLVIISGVGALNGQSKRVTISVFHPSTSLSSSLAKCDSDYIWGCLLSRLVYLLQDHMIQGTSEERQQPQLK